ncbi:ArsR/SmtB family transcription factor [Blastochloris viridis]|uniref:Transcriptional regulator n=1 Tax=Blastochloris viridis TaxID=1079 RepID=A0A0H5BHN0_BLAVI|nr:metalloregulator ArsR/SmtB family transcription factor [Blastochloris viridis]ALK09449.1 putative HTH-type transcriptional regulator YgaV [Blastochloris viridis]BAS00670.1 transcriptional regulator [Blastochloris viridis]CUU42112.1 putative HTH-type transcriptional regulator ygaV [Blastochloris viridis]
MELENLSARAAEAEAFLKALANRYRLMVLCELHRGERSVGELQDMVGLSQSALSQHLARLRADALVATRRDGHTIFYSIASPGVSRVIAVLYDLYCADSCGRTSSRPAEIKQGKTT